VIEFVVYIEVGVWFVVIVEVFVFELIDCVVEYDCDGFYLFEVIDVFKFVGYFVVFVLVELGGLGVFCVYDFVVVLSWFVCGDVLVVIGVNMYLVVVFNMECCYCVVVVEGNECCVCVFVVLFE